MVFRTYQRAPFIYSLPSSHFDLALLWEPTRDIERRVIAESAEKRSYSIPDFPSWSWAGWVGSVTFKDSTVGGLLGNVSEWIDTHTWIEWLVRDGHGDLRPLWESRKFKIDRSTDCRWRGYRRSGARADRLRRAPPKVNDRYQPEDEHPFEAQNGDEEESSPGHIREQDQNRDSDVSSGHSRKRT